VKQKEKPRSKERLKRALLQKRRKKDKLEKQQKMRKRG